MVSRLKVVQFLLIIVCGFASLAAFASPRTIHLVLPVTAENPKLCVYFHDLIQQALEDSGFRVTIAKREVPQKRAAIMLQQGELSAIWAIASKERNQKYLPVPVGLTNGLIGKRIFLIRPDDQQHFDQIIDLESLRQSGLVAAMGPGWFDSKVWQSNQLSYSENSSNWVHIYDMLRFGRVYDYFPRGLNEILLESEQHPELAIERNLVLVYARDFQFYLSKTGPFAGVRYQDAITTALEEAKKRGLIDNLVHQYWGADYEALGYDQRIKIYLNTPTLN